MNGVGERSPFKLFGGGFDSLDNSSEEDCVVITYQLFFSAP